jgi:hypothetical protein
MKRRAPFWVIAMVCGNLVWLAMATVALVGIENTPYDAQDSRRRPMGFNDKLSSEHYTIMVRNFRMNSLFDFRYAFEWIYFCAMVLGLVIVCGRLFASKFAKAFFFLQLFLLPIALMGGMILFQDAMAIPRGLMDREEFVDVPFWNVLVSSPVWVVTCITALYFMFGKRAAANQSLVTSFPTID